jgi:hypothetical protein
MGGNEYIQPVPPRNRNPDAKGFCITNIGIGSAKAIKTEWLYDKKSVDHLADGHYSFFDKMGNGDKTFINFLRPGDEARIILPLYYLICCGTALNLKSSSSGSDGKFGYKPPLQLQIEYLDIYNKSFTSKFSVDVTAYSDLVTLNFGPPDKLVKG